MDSKNKDAAGDGPKLQTRWYEAHSLAGVLVLVPLFIILVAGTISFFHEELLAWHTPALRVEYAPLPDSVDPLLTGLLEEVPKGVDKLWIRLPNPHRPVILATWPDGAGAYTTLGLNPNDGSLIREVELSTELADHIYHWHYLDPLPLGLQISGAVALVWFALTISGIYIHRKKLLSQFKGWRGKRGRALHSWLHTVIGTLTLPLHLIYGVTGVFFGLNMIALPLVVILAFDGDQKAAMETLYGVEAPASFTDTQVSVLPEFDPFFERTRAEFPGAEIEDLYIERPYDEGALMHMHVHTEAGDGEVKFEINRSLEPVAVVPGDAIPSGLKILFAAVSLHFGNFGGIVVKCIYTIGGLALCLLTYAGTRLWIARLGKRQPRMSVLLDRLFDGVALGMLPALAVFAWANRLIPRELVDRGHYEIQVFHLAWLLLALLVLVLGTGPERRRWLLIATVALLAVVPFLDGFMYGAWPWSAVSWHVPSVAVTNWILWLVPVCWVVSHRLRRSDVSG